MLERFVKEARWVAAEAQDEARAHGSPTIEAEHVLLALSRGHGGVAGPVLAEAGLDHAALEEALEADFERSLSVVGVAAGSLNAGAPAPFSGRPRWGTSAKSSLERALVVAQARGDRRIGDGHVLLAVLGAREGTVPRALREAGIEPADLAARTQAAMERSR